MSIACTDIVLKIKRTSPLLPRMLKYANLHRNYLVLFH